MDYDTYETTDIFLASYLLATGHTDYSLNREGRQVTFVFRSDRTYNNEKYFEIIVDKYFSEENFVVPKLLFNAYKELKGRIFDGV